MVSNMKKPKFSVVSFLDILGYKEIIKDSESDYSEPLLDRG